MPLTEAQLDVVRLLLDGNPSDPDSVYIEKLLTELVQLRDHVRAILGVHSYYPGADSLTALQGIKSSMIQKANDLVTLLS